MSEWTITLVVSTTGQSETITVPSSTSLVEVVDWAKALFGLAGDHGPLSLFLDGKRLQVTNDDTLQSAGCNNGDVIAVQEAAAASARAAAPSASNALDFSTLLSGAPPSQQQQVSSSSSGGLDFSRLLQQAPTSTTPPAPVYWNGMNVSEATQYNPHPHAFITLLRSKEHLIKELNYYDPQLATQLRNAASLELAVELWRKNLVESGIQNAMKVVERDSKERDMTSRLASNPNDVEAKEYFAAKTRRGKVQEQYEQMMNDYPEALGQVLMLYVHAKINGHPVQAFCDSGAQATIISLRVAKECGLDDLIDTRFQGIAKGVGTGKIVGRIHMVQLQIGEMYFPCSVTVMDDAGSGSDMPFLFGLDMMKRHLCQIDLEKGVLKFRLGPEQYMETPFLHEKDLDEAQGGTKGFNADAANQKLLEAMEESRKKRRAEDGSNGGAKGDDDEDDMLEG